MPQCVLKNCKNNYRKKKVSDGISYFRFPGNPVFCWTWTSIVRKERQEEFWSPSKNSVICSIHFDKSDIVGKSERVRLRKKAIPRLQIYLPSQDDVISEAPNSEEADDEEPQPDPPSMEVPVTIKLEVEEDISEHEEDLMEQLENRKRLQEQDPIAIDVPKKVKVEYVPETVPSPSQPLLQPQYQTVPQTLLHHQIQSSCQPLSQPLSQINTWPQPQTTPDTNDSQHVISQNFMTSVMRNQNEILNILKRQVLLQDPDPEMLTFLRFLGSKMMRFTAEKRKELQDKIYEIVLNE